MKEGDSETALKLARRAYLRRPHTPWVLTTLFDLQTRSGLWTEALSTVGDMAKHKLIDRQTATRWRALLFHQQAAAQRAPGGPTTRWPWRARRTSCCPISRRLRSRRARSPSRPTSRAWRARCCSGPGAPSRTRRWPRPIWARRSGAGERTAEGDRAPAPAEAGRPRERAGARRAGDRRQGMAGRAQLWSARASGRRPPGCTVCSPRSRRRRARAIRRARGSPRRSTRRRTTPGCARPPGRCAPTGRRSAPTADSTACAGARRPRSCRCWATRLRS